MGYAVLGAWGVRFRDHEPRDVSSEEICWWSATDGSNQSPQRNHRQSHRTRSFSNTCEILHKNPFVALIPKGPKPSQKKKKPKLQKGARVRARTGLPALGLRTSRPGTARRSAAERVRALLVEGSQVQLLYRRFFVLFCFFVCFFFFWGGEGGGGAGRLYSGHVPSSWCNTIWTENHPKHARHVFTRPLL